MRRAADLSRCDLVSEMVLEFDELQGQIGTIYAALDGESREVSQAIQGLHQRRLAHRIPSLVMSMEVCSHISGSTRYLAGLFAINQPPTGSKDPLHCVGPQLDVLRLNEHPLLQVRSASVDQSSI